MPRESLNNWGPFFRLGIPGVVTVTLEESLFEVVTFIAGTLNETLLAAQSIIWQIQSFSYVIPFGLSVTVNILVSNHLGAKSFAKAKRVYDSSLILVVVVTSLQIVSVLCFQNFIISLITSDEAVKEESKRLIWIVCILPMVEGIQSISEGVLAALSLQFVGLILVIIGYFLISVPIGWIIFYYAIDHFRNQLEAFWISAIAGVVAIAFLATVLARFLNWSHPKFRVVEDEYAKDFKSLLKNEPYSNGEILISMLEREDRPEIIDTNLNQDKSFIKLLFFPGLYFLFVFVIMVASIVNHSLYTIPGLEEEFFADGTGAAQRRELRSGFADRSYSALIAHPYATVLTATDSASTYWGS
ncbi:hypothetical protein Ciccas_000546 [Cichlidogyrus casuarinus]|uniref:Uncharacterized protein n=1 Tax=Cichlidogyrus casuarinus TaxID=1844966 RepID=A0ABD2QML4_9PLAT